MMALPSGELWNRVMASISATVKCRDKVSIVTACRASIGTSLRISAMNSSRRLEGTCWARAVTISSNTDSLGIVLTYRWAAARRAVSESADCAAAAEATASASSVIVAIRAACRMRAGLQILDVHGLTARRTLGHCIGELHVTHAILEVGVRDLLAPADGVHELFFHPPADALLRRNGDLLQLLVAASAAGEPLGIDLDAQRPFAAEDPRLGRRRKRGQRGKAQVGDRPALEVDEDVDVVGHLDLVPLAALVLALGRGDLGHGHDPPGGAEPAHHRLIPDAHVQDVVAGEIDVLPPVQRVALLREARLLGALHLDRVQRAGVALGDQLLELAIHF